ncbi:hypothetical protein NA57DRAFT_39758 [Rhizodiscina lignyota]|uniref:dolichol kinase n=1 Tax=Rhizodiscina lignyota TaxID=1504668 RepID=A0A9P4IGA8_9PEZI|nr:hypothetical protein NA57DRAFT_39758 [Rhizodiscina lignyota]
MSSSTNLDVPPAPQQLEESIVQDEEDESGPNADALRLLSRSPHPYAFHRSSSAEFDASAAPDRNNSPRVRTNGSSATLKTPSESGTEADDESYGYGFVRALPAPPLRPNKGLRRSVDHSSFDGARRSSEDIRAEASPWLTPSQLLDEDERARHGSDYFTSSRGVRKRGTAKPRKGADTTSAEEEARVARERIRKKKRAELIRRSVEMMLLGIIAHVLMVLFLNAHASELASGTVVLWVLFALYPIRLLWYNYRRAHGKTKSIFSSIRIPVAFDPAPLFYPTTIPVLVAASLIPSSTKYLLPNIVLSLAALPLQVIPLAYVSGIRNMSHWFISLVPLMISQNTAIPSKLAATMPYNLKASPDDSVSPEIIASLYALHHALLGPLQFVTSTSLLPSELHLLSIALINLLLFSKSPQALILDILLWFGGVTLFVTCGHVIRWGIALARIPKWRLRRAGRIVGMGSSFISALNDALIAKNKHLKDHRDSYHSSDTEPEDDVAQPRNGLSKLDALKAELLSALKTNLLSGEEEGEVKSAVESSGIGTTTLDPTAAASLRKRRNTLPILSRQNSKEEPPSRSNQVRRRRKRSSIVEYFLSLTPEQAAVRKWYYAGYVYAMILAIILGPIRSLVASYALNGYEPFGWAISYLFGNVPALRFATVQHDLESWIPLPPLGDASSSTHIPFPRGIVDMLLTNLGLSPGPATTRLLLTLYCGLVMSVGIITVLLLSPFIEVDTRRKVFHFTMVALLLPAIAVDPCFISLALALVLAIFLLLELLRASQLPPLSKPIAIFLAPYVDGRDLRGPVVVSHIFLLIGCAIPLWLSMAGVERAPTSDEDAWKGWSTQERNLSMLSGVICVGLGDAFASLVGRRFGRHKWPWAGGKSLEGSAAFATAVVGGLIIGKGLLNLVLEGRLIVNDAGGAVFTITKAAIAGSGASLMEAVLTGGNDNVIVPVVLWLLVRAVGL